MNSSARLTGVDALRGIASLAVCWFHLTAGYVENSLIRNSGRFGWLGVDVFFVISGFIIPLAMYSGGYSVQKNWWQFVWKRIVRIDPPYLVATALALGLWYMSSVVPGFRGDPPNPSVAQLVLHLGYLNGIAGYPWLNPVFWTLAIEFQYYLLMSLILGLVTSKRWPVIMYTALLFTLVPMFSEGGAYVFHYLSLFLLGIAVFQYQVHLITRNALLVILFLASVSVAHALGIADMFAGLVAAAIILSRWNLGNSRALLFLGSISYSLYLIHVPIGGRVVSLGRRFVETQTGELALSCTALFVCIVSATLFWRWFEQPAQRWASRLKYHERA